MKTMFRRVAASTMLVLWSMPVMAQTADEIIEKHLSASGGRAALSKLTSRKAAGTITIGTPIGDLMGTVEVYNKVPNKTRTLAKVDLSAVGGGQVINDQRFDGSTGYVIDTLNGDREITGSQLDAMRNGSFPTPLLSYKERGVQATLTGREKAGAGEAFVIVLTPKTGPPTKVYIDTESSMLVKTAITVNVPQLGGDIEQVVEFSDFRDVDGIKLPYTTRSANPVQTITATVTEVTHNIEIDDKSFVKP